ncbi:related to 60s ribosomal protein L2 (mitochondrial) [Cephalotrichum gorgonifer]|uniref:Large ribosomal subunit protein bL27m n=1 Tax=Cephalotrichum gorgonifer TaxID=2041049 RepID=A0AAE8SSV9_9PEZI|nr:related to 60s ribosomal protein L2 (mitochondrial) [Cephalotrichum gorgonifer]
MSLAQLQRPLAAAASGLSTRLLATSLALPWAAQWRGVDANVLVEGRRGAKVKAQGHYNLKPKRTIPKKLGAKRTGDQHVIPGNIIYRQHGTHWWPGENCIMGRDFTIHSMATGYVKYYRDPSLSPDRKYIGVVFNKEDTLPYPKHAERKRRLGMTATVVREAARAPEVSGSGIPSVVRRTDPDRPLAEPQVLSLKKDYTYREDNWRIGRLVQTTGLQIKGFKSRRAYMRHRRWAREQSLAGLKKVRAKLEQDDSNDEWVEAAREKAAQLQLSRKQKGHGTKAKKQKAPKRR